MPFKDPIKQKEYFKKYNILNFEKRQQQRFLKKEELKKYMKKWRKENKEHLIQYRKDNYNTKENTEYCRKRQEKYPEYYAKYREEYNKRKQVIARKRESNLKKKYKIDLKDYNKMFKEQKGKCAICNKHQKKLKTVLHVDHCHKTNQVRGLLCNRCNAGLGYYEDFNKNAVEKYLKKYRNKLN